MSTRIKAHYLIETAHDPAAAAEMMAGEQSAGTFVKVPGETPELLAAHGARVEDLTLLESVDTPSLPGSKPPKGFDGRYRRARVTLSFPFENIGASLTTLYTAVAGNLFELSPFNGLQNKFCENDASVIAAARDLLTPMPGIGAVAMPVFSSGQSAKQIPNTYAALDSMDWLYLAGGGIMAHPGGAASGVRALQQAWEAARVGTPLVDYARSHAELAGALERFGR